MIPVTMLNEGCYHPLSFGDRFWKFAVIGLDVFHDTKWIM